MDIQGQVAVTDTDTVIDTDTDTDTDIVTVTVTADAAAGLLNCAEDAPTAMTKHAAVAFAGRRRIAYGRRSLRVACLCPQAVATAMTARGTGLAEVYGMLSPAQMAADVVAALHDETFLVLPHPEVFDDLRGNTANCERWPGGMQKRCAVQTSTTQPEAAP